MEDTMDLRVRNRMADDAHENASLMLDELRHYGDEFTKGEKALIDQIARDLKTLSDQINAHSEVKA
jgi:hypothetical protein